MRWSRSLHGKYPSGDALSFKQEAISPSAHSTPVTTPTADKDFFRQVFSVLSKALSSMPWEQFGDHEAHEPWLCWQRKAEVLVFPAPWSHVFWWSNLKVLKAEIHKAVTSRMSTLVLPVPKKPNGLCVQTGDQHGLRPSLCCSSSCLLGPRALSQSRIAPPFSLLLLIHSGEFQPVL